MSGVCIRVRGSYQVGCKVALGRAQGLRSGFWGFGLWGEAWVQGVGLKAQTCPRLRSHELRV